MESSSNDKDTAPAEPAQESEPAELPRKASEIILAIERRFDVVLQTAANTDANTKLVLARMNKVCSLLDGILTQLKIVNGVEEDPVVNVSEPPQIEVETSPKGFRRTARPETYPDEKSEKVIPTQQKVMDPSGKSVFMAEVEILNPDRSLVTKLRTTAGGKWQVPLIPGNYIVTILKRENGTRKKMTFTTAFSVPESTVPIELEPAKLELEK